MAKLKKLTAEPVERTNINGRMAWRYVWNNGEATIWFEDDIPDLLLPSAPYLGSDHDRAKVLQS